MKLEIEYNCRNNGLDLGYHQNGKIKIYIRAHLIRTWDIKHLIEEIDDSFLHEYIHFLNGNISHRKMFKLRQAMIGDADFLPKTNVIQK